MMQSSQTNSSGNPSPLSISIAMATYQGEKHIREQLDSIADQTLLPLEIVITDDGSSDRTLEIAEEFAKTAPFPVRIVRNDTRLRYADNFLRAASLCRGDLIAFCDQDDIWKKEKLSVCSGFFADPEVLLAVHSAQTLTKSNELGFCYPHFSRTRVRAAGCTNPFDNRPGFAMVFRRQLLSLSDGADRPVSLYSHDHWVWFLAVSAGKIATISQILSLYRQHETNVFGAADNKTLADKVRIGIEIPRYTELADAELACSETLSRATNRLPPEWIKPVTHSAAALAFRSRLHRLRGRIYGERRPIPSRLATFLSIMLAGGYFPDPAETRLGPLAAVKDLAIGVLGVGRGVDISAK